MSQPLVSIIIASLNEEKHIANCLNSIANQTYPQKLIETILVDGQSKDNTVKIAKKMGFKVYLLKKYPKLKNFRGAQINQGVAKSHGTILFFPDVDMTYDKELISESVNLMSTYDALYVPEIIIGSGYFGKIRNFERSFYNQTVIDAARIIKLSYFQKAGGYDVDNIVFGADDWDFNKTLKKSGANFGITKSKIYHHVENLSLLKYLQKKSKYARTFDGYINKWGKNDEDIRKQLGVYYRAIGVFFEKGKWKNLITHPGLALSMYLVRFLTWLLYIVGK